MSGFVLDPSGASLEAVNVVLVTGSEPGDTANRRVAFTSVTGAFSFDLIDHRDSVITARGIAFDTQWRRYTGARGISDTLCIEMRARPIYLIEVGTRDPLEAPMRSPAKRPPLRLTPSLPPAAALPNTREVPRRKRETHPSISRSASLDLGVNARSLLSLRHRNGDQFSLLGCSVI